MWGEAEGMGRRGGTRLREEGPPASMALMRRAGLGESQLGWNARTQSTLWTGRLTQASERLPRLQGRAWGVQGGVGVAEARLGESAARFPHLQRPEAPLQL